MTESEETPRTWLPLIIAGSIAALVVGGVVVVHLLRADLAPEKQAAVTACETQFKTDHPKGPGFVGGDIYSAAEWQLLLDRMVALGYLTEQQATLTGEQADARDDEAAALVVAGGDTMTVVWQLDDQSHATCAAKMQDGKVTSVEVIELTKPGVAPTPTPTPTP